MSDPDHIPDFIPVGQSSSTDDSRSGDFSNYRPFGRGFRGNNRFRGGGGGRGRRPYGRGRGGYNPNYQAWNYQDSYQSRGDHHQQSYGQVHISAYCKDALDKNPWSKLESTPESDPVPPAEMEATTDLNQ